MQKIKVVGVGPGSASCLTPEAAGAIQWADVLIGAKRHLQTFAVDGQETIVLDKSLSEVVQCIHQRRHQRISVLASGDPGLFGILKFLLKHFDVRDVEVIPGISAIQAAFAKLSMPWEDAVFFSAHGRSAENIERLAETAGKLAILTGNDNPPVKIFEMFSHSNRPKTIYCCYDLSLPEEAIIRLQTGDHFPQAYIKRTNCVMVVIDEGIQ